MDVEPMGDAAPLSNDEIARAISSHRFDAAYPYLEDDVTWSLVGQGRLEGREAFVGACETTAAELNGVSTEFRQFRVLVGHDWVVIDSLAAYTTPDGPATTVASCDIYEFRDGRLAELTSYNIELGEGS
ncbi:MAG TPA: nuclear transport factor 2 family protein [Candidatus Limnocylindrales bacterium]|nr:nuclear transport factor 2 family protein [Candidatus Limnocylindrales bacterium]